MNQLANNFCNLTPFYLSAKTVVDELLKVLVEERKSNDINDVVSKDVSEEIVQDIRKLACSVDGVIEIEKTYIRKTGSSFLVDIHVVVLGTLTVAGGHKIAHDVKGAIIETEPRVRDVLVHIEPDTF